MDQNRDRQGGDTSESEEKDPGSEMGGGTGSGSEMGGGTGSGSQPGMGSGSDTGSDTGSGSNGGFDPGSDVDQQSHTHGESQTEE